MKRRPPNTLFIWGYNGFEKGKLVFFQMGSKSFSWG